MAYRQLPIVEVGLSDLFLDLKNYRVPTHSANSESALHDLFASEDVLGAARLILRDGYFDNEVPIVVATGDESRPSYTVLEGNRRVSALKALKDPAIVPSHEAEIRELLKRFALESDHLPERIRVIVSPSRDEAAPHIARLHTGIPKKRWSRDQQATFYYSLLSEEVTVDDVRARYPAADITRFMKMAVMRRFVTAVAFTDHKIRRYAASGELAMSAFEYAYRNKDIAREIGVQFDKDGMLEPQSSTPETIASHLPGRHLRALEYLIEAFHTQRLNTRSVELKRDHPSHLKLLSQLRGAASSRPRRALHTQSGAIQAAGIRRDKVTERTTGLSQAVVASPGISPVPRMNEQPSRQLSSDVLDLSGIDFDLIPFTLKARYAELSTLSISSFPIATAILMRSILVETVETYVERSGIHAPGSFNKVFDRVVRAHCEDPIFSNEFDICQADTAKDKGSLRWLRDVVHSSVPSPNPADLHQAWENLGPLVKRLSLHGSPPAPESL